jgi:peptidoglycan/LPS O-acetylase OafA/YrhL
MILALGGVALGFGRSWRAFLFRAAVPLGALALFIRLLLAADVDGGAQHSFFFFAGSTIYLLGDRIPVSSRTILPLIAVLAVGLIDTRAFFIAYLAVVPLLTLNLAYAPGERLMQFNRIGDYSYGLYIYAYPITQAVIATHPGITFGALNLLSTPLTLVPAVLSWRLIEKPALARKQALAAAVSRRVAGLQARVKRLAGAKDLPVTPSERP